MEEKIILVNEKDEEKGIAGKLEVHQKGLLHRAFSVFIFNRRGELLLQKRADSKYHSPGLWTNTCCSHPRPGEPTIQAAARRLKEEMGIVAQLKFFTTFQYRSEFENGLTEHELDHVFYGVTDEKPKPDTEEVSEWKYIQADDLIDDLNSNHDKYTSWLKICLDRKIFQKLLEEIK